MIDKVCLQGVPYPQRGVGWDPTIQVARFEGEQSETVRIERRFAGSCPRCSSHGLLRGTCGKRNYRIGDSVIRAVENAAHSARVVNDAVGLATLDHRQP